MAKGTVVPGGQPVYLWQGKRYGPGDTVPEGFPTERFAEYDKTHEAAVAAAPENKAGASGSGQELTEATQVSTPVLTADALPAKRRATAGERKGKAK